MRPLNPPIADWTDRKVWLIGASSGIGEALVRELQHQGACLALSARRQDQLERLARERDIVVPLDVTDQPSVIRGWQQIVQSWGDMDTIIYCAGNYTPMRAWEIDVETVKQTFAVNLTGVYNLLQAVVDHLLERGHGHVCLVGSVAGYTGLPKALAYGPSKAALINLAQILYEDLSPRGIGVSLVNPGFVDTRLTKQNDFQMPALMTPESAARAILRGFQRGVFEIHFPRRFSFWMKMLAYLPDRWRFALLRRTAA